jgi:putative methionine-R-sulfoxide reductase with GAF domain
MYKMVNKSKIIGQLQNCKQLPYEEIENGMFWYWKGFYLGEGGQLSDRRKSLILEGSLRNCLWHHSFQKFAI